VVDAAVEKAYGGKRKISWMNVFAGEKRPSRFRSKITGCPKKRLHASKNSGFPSRVLDHAVVVAFALEVALRQAA